MPLSKLTEVFSDYEEQHELAGYISAFASESDIELLIKLNRGKAEEVVQASRAALVELFDGRDNGVLEQMARSRSENIALTFEAIAVRLGERMSLESIRSGLQSRELWRRLFSVYALANAESADLKTLQKFIRHEASERVKSASVKTTVRLAMRLGNRRLLKECLSSDSDSGRYGAWGDRRTFFRY